ncbi:DUF3006 domain-containing protein [Cytobacillus oceanisediminis]|uniref:DUF3006 domain-containing protein n=1 Tax=Cytobacillus oceanisediminis TaxID=665099 RepID=UPI0037364B3A
MKFNKYTLDRFEGDQAVLLLKNNEAQELIIRRNLLGEDVQEGDILQLEISQDGSITKITPLKQETASMKNKVDSLINKLKNK